MFRVYSSHSFITNLVFKVFVTRRSLVGHVGDSNISMCRQICMSSSVVSGLLEKKSTSRVLLGTWSVVCRVTLERLAVTHLTRFQLFPLNDNVIVCVRFAL